jgi:hypothetical protein
MDEVILEYIQFAGDGRAHEMVLKISRRHTSDNGFGGFHSSKPLKALDFRRG